MPSKNFIDPGAVQPQPQLPFDSDDRTRLCQILADDDEDHRSIAEQEFFARDLMIQEVKRRIVDG